LSRFFILSAFLSSARLGPNHAFNRTRRYML
jgi:hypothetical protein